MNPKHALSKVRAQATHPEIEKDPQHQIALNLDKYEWNIAKETLNATLTRYRHAMKNQGIKTVVQCEVPPLDKHNENISKYMPSP